MTPQTYRARWKAIAAGTGISRSLVKLSHSVEGVSPETTAFLQTMGLPEDAAPFLSFNDLANRLRPVFAVYGRLEEWSEADKARLSPYLMIGSDGSGNPLCVDTAQGDAVVLLDHEREFVPLRFVNSGVAQLGECLLIFAEMIQTFQQTRTEEMSFLDGVPRSLWEQTSVRLAAADPAAVEKGAFWYYEMESTPRLPDADQDTTP